MKYEDAIKCVEKIIGKARVHLYKPIQIAEILFRARHNGDIDLGDLATYRTQSRKWRDTICNQFLGRSSTSSARYQDDLFNENAVPPRALVALGSVNSANGGCVEAFIYQEFIKRHSQMNAALAYSRDKDSTSFDLVTFIELFRNDAGLRRSVDKMFEIIVYSLFESLIRALRVSVKVSLDPTHMELLEDFGDFTNSVLGLSAEKMSMEFPARFFRVGVTNAADRGLDMYGNFGFAVQIKHISLSFEQAEDITSDITADRVVLVCRDADHDLILAVLQQIGWTARVQAVVLESHLIRWYEYALRGSHRELLADTLLSLIRDEIVNEFPSQAGQQLQDFMIARGYEVS
jgi:hypothetical protein